MKARIEGREIVIESETDSESIAMETLLNETNGKCTKYIMKNEISKPYDSEEKRFTCPECGSRMFGSSTNGDGTYTRHCRGNEEWKCNFSFHESEDDKYIK